MNSLSAPIEIIHLRVIECGSGSIAATARFEHRSRAQPV